MRHTGGRGKVDRMVKLLREAQKEHDLSDAIKVGARLEQRPDGSYALVGGPWTWHPRRPVTTAQVAALLGPGKRITPEQFMALVDQWDNGEQKA